MTTNSLYAIIAVSIAAVLGSMFFAMSRGKTINDIQFEKVRAQSLLDVAKLEAESKAKRLECVERVSKALGGEAAARKGTGGTQSELERLCP